MKKELLISVIMAEYNTDENLFLESVKSILSQTYKNFELIIIDDCGKNDVNSLIKNFNDKRIKVFKNEKNMGLVFSLNKAIDLSKGEYIARMDTDDYSYQQRFTIEKEFLEKNPDISLVCSNCDFYDGEKIWASLKNESGIITHDNLLKGTPIIHPTVMMRKDDIVKIGKYVNYNRCEDYATWIEFYANNLKMYKLSNILLRYHLSVEDYKKRTLKTRKGFFQLLKYQYIKLNPSFYQYMKIYVKNILAGIFPKRIMLLYHKKKFNRERK